MAPTTRELGSSEQIKPEVIAGFCVSSALILFGLLWIVIRSCRKRSQIKREDARGGAFLHVHGVVKDEKNSNENILPRAIQALRISETQPVRDVVPATTTGNKVSERRTARAMIPPRPFNLSQPPLGKPPLPPARAVSYHLPLSFAPPPTGKPPLPSQNQESHFRRTSKSSLAPFTRESVYAESSSSTRCSTASASSALAQMSKRKVRQTFNPVLPDELVISDGERLTVLHSFDDGWCIVGRPSLGSSEDVELGAVPAWCFIQPVLGLRTERPRRRTSLGVTTHLDQPLTREDLMTWSNF